ncbi:MAG TPA: hypothetical protein VFW50_39100, partial [Streptosporangiaceae bacterium]|nr:hypothetical protein [Streptosporangiaceae bacterium]
GPVFLFGLLAGLAGIFTFRRRRDPGLALACLLVTGSAVAVLLGADLYEFSWRYQLPALITLPVAAVLGVTAVTRHIQARRAAGGRAAAGTAQARSASAEEVAAEELAPGKLATGELAAAVPEQTAS